MQTRNIDRYQQFIDYINHLREEIQVPLAYTLELLDLEEELSGNVPADSIQNLNRYAMAVDAFNDYLTNTAMEDIYALINESIEIGHTSEAVDKLIDKTMREILDTQTTIANFVALVISDESFADLTEKLIAHMGMISEACNSYPGNPAVTMTQPQTAVTITQPQTPSKTQSQLSQSDLLVEIQKEVEIFYTDMRDLERAVDRQTTTHINILDIFKMGAKAPRDPEGRSNLTFITLLNLILEDHLTIKTLTLSEFAMSLKVLCLQIAKSTTIKGIQWKQKELLRTIFDYTDRVARLIERAIAANKAQISTPTPQIESKQEEESKQEDLDLSSIIMRKPISMIQQTKLIQRAVNQDAAQGVTYLSDKRDAILNKMIENFHVVMRELVNVHHDQSKSLLESIAHLETILAKQSVEINTLLQSQIDKPFFDEIQKFYADCQMELRKNILYTAFNEQLDFAIAKITKDEADIRRSIENSRDTESKEVICANNDLAPIQALLSHLNGLQSDFREIVEANLSIENTIGTLVHSLSEMQNSRMADDLVFEFKKILHPFSSTLASFEALDKELSSQSYKPLTTEHRELSKLKLSSAIFQSQIRQLTAERPHDWNDKFEGFKAQFFASLTQESEGVIAQSIADMKQKYMETLIRFELTITDPKLEKIYSRKPSQVIFAVKDEQSSVVAQGDTNNVTQGNTNF